MPGGARPFLTFNERSRSNAKIVYRSSQSGWFWLFVGPVFGGIILVRSGLEGPLFGRGSLPWTLMILFFMLFWAFMIAFRGNLRSTLELDLAEGRVLFRDRRLTGRIDEWTLAKDEVERVFVKVDLRDVAEIEITLKNGKSFVLDEGVDGPPARTFAADLARCWGVPLKP